MTREKPTGRHPKFEGTIPKVFNVSIPEKFQDIYEKINKLADTDNNQDFLEYCLNMENVDLSKLKMNRRSIYIRWVLAKHTITNLSIINNNGM